MGEPGQGVGVAGLLGTSLKFASERHPYEKALSFAHFEFRGEHAEPAAFRSHLDDVVRVGAYQSFPIYTIDEEPVIDDWIFHDSLESDLDRIAKRLGLPTPLQVPRARSSHRVDRTPAAEILTGAQKRIVQSRCAPEFDLFGWER